MTILKRQKRLLRVLLRALVDTEEVISEAWLLPSERRKKRDVM
jgi:hypothetical protein